MPFSGPLGLQPPGGGNPSVISGSPSSSGSPHQDHSLLHSPPGGLDKDDSSLDSSEQPKFRFVILYSLVPLCSPCRVEN